ncbi:MAG: helix-turn-helix transcriptional regulator [Mediterranea sp.]|nr:helix-turn-helix transcriptional regulator [Mediterranea sp.]
MDDRGIKVSWLAKQIHCADSNVYHIYGNPCISTDQLLKISIALEHDFFQYYSDVLHEP